MTTAPLTLMHLANSNSTNIGNGALILGSERVIGEDFGRPITWVREPWDDYTFDIRVFDRAFVDRVNRETDGLIVGGAVAIHGREYLRNAGMRFDLPLELWREFRKPVVFYGLSHRHWSHQPFHHLEKLRGALAQAAEMPNMLFSVRNDGTKEWLEALMGNALPAVEIIPDPAIYVPHDEGGDYPELRADRHNVILAFNNEDAIYRYGGPVRSAVSAMLGRFLDEKLVMRIGARLGGMEKRRSRIVDAIIHAFDRLLREDQVNILLVPHYFDDYQMMSEFVNRCRPRVAHQHMLSTGLVPLAGTHRFYGRYSRAAMSVSMRVHSMSPSFGLGVPMVPLITQERMWAFLREAGIADLGIDAFDPDLADKLYAAMAWTLANGDQVRSRFAEAKSRFREQSRAFHLRMAGLWS